MSTRILFFAEDRGRCPFLDWLRELPQKPRIKVMGYVEQLAVFGNQLRRPVADHLGEGIFDFRPTHMGIHYRVLYFYHGRDAVVISHGIVKEAKVPRRELDLAIRHRQQFKLDPTS